MAAWEEIQIGAELPGVRVEAVLIEVGDAVRKGDIVVRLDARTASAQLARSNAAVREAEAALVLAASRAKRTRALVAEALLPAQDVDDVDAGEARARAQLDTAQANRDVAQLQVDFANSILVVDYAVDAMRLHGMSRHDALIDACHKRARPVVMTTLAMIAGMLPIALGYAADSSFRAPMAIAVIGGLITSTMLSLVVVPAAFTLVEDMEHWIFRRRAPRPADMAGAKAVEG